MIRFLEGCKTRRRFSATVVILIDKMTLKESPKKTRMVKIYGTHYCLPYAKELIYLVEDKQNKSKQVLLVASMEVVKKHVDRTRHMFTCRHQNAA